MFAWVETLVGNDITLRSLHHWAMWYFILFTVVHIYLVFYHDYVEGRGEISSMGAGYKFIEEEVFQEHAKQIENDFQRKKDSIFEKSKPLQS